MNVHIITHQHSDGNVRVLTEGWLLNGGVGRMRVRVSGSQAYLPAAEDFWETLPETDAVIFAVTSGPEGSNYRRAWDALTRHDLWKRTVMLDYHDSARNWPYGQLMRRCKVAFLGRRHLYEAQRPKNSNARWWPRLGIEERVLRYHGSLPWAMWKDIPAVCLFKVYAKAEHRAKWMGLAKGVRGVLTGTATHGEKHPLYERSTGSRHSPNYLELLSRSRVGIHLLGGNTAMGYQFWEYAALGCAILAQHPSLHPQCDIERAEWEALGLKEGEDFEYFRNEQDFKHKLADLVANPSRCERMASDVMAKTAPYRSAERACYMHEQLHQLTHEDAG